MWIKWIDVGRLRQSVNTSTTRLNQSVSSTPTSWFNKLWCLVFFCRWQYGFRDLSIPEVELSRKKKKKLKWIVSRFNNYIFSLLIWRNQRTLCLLLFLFSRTSYDLGWFLFFYKWFTQFPLYHYGCSIKHIPFEPTYCIQYTFAFCPVFLIWTLM